MKAHNNYVIIAVLLLLSSCYTANKATKQVAKAQAIHPEVVADACANYYPVKDSIVERTTIIPGRTDTSIQYVQVDCDSVLIHDTVIRDHVVKVPVKSSVRVDTIVQYKSHYVESTAKVTALTNEVNAGKIQAAKLEDKVKDKNRIILYMAIAIAIMIALAFIGLYLSRVKNNKNESK